jgi:hypothetical protein
MRIVPYLQSSSYLLRISIGDVRKDQPLPKPRICEDSHPPCPLIAVLEGVTTANTGILGHQG